MHNFWAVFLASHLAGNAVVVAVYIERKSAAVRSSQERRGHAHTILMRSLLYRTTTPNPTFALCRNTRFHWGLSYIKPKLYVLDIAKCALKKLRSRCPAVLDVAII